MSTGRLYTVGHGTRSTAELAAVLGQAGVGRVVDVRRHPGSRRHPHLGRDALALGLGGLGVAYEWRGEPLGGRRRLAPGPSRHPAWRDESFRAFADHMDTPGFRAALDALVVEVVADTERGLPSTAIMCAETLWWRCHRRLIADAAVLAGLEVVHLLGLGQSQPHPLHPALRADGEGRPIYDLGVQPELASPFGTGAASPDPDAGTSRGTTRP